MKWYLKHTLLKSWVSKKKKKTLMCLCFQDTDETEPIDLIKSQICDNVALYAQKYDEEFEVEKWLLIFVL